MSFRYDLAPFVSFRDAEACARVRAIPRERMADHPNRDFQIRLEEEPAAFYTAFADDLVGRIRTAREEGRELTLILPVGPMPQYALAARSINDERLSLGHVHTFNMDEYADQDGRTAPASWTGSFARAMQEHFFGRIDAELRPPESQIHFPSHDHDRRLLQADRGARRRRRLLRRHRLERAHRVLGAPTRA